MRLVSWNVNGYRAAVRKGMLDWLAAEAPDVLCLQETKCRDAEFPLAAFREAGYPYAALHGQKGYHGVATLSRLPLEAVDRRSFCERPDARHVAASVMTDGAPVTVHNLYVPAGGDEPDAAANWKFAHKLSFVSEMEEWLGEAARADTLVVGDLNIAPLPTDVWSHKQLLDVVSHTPVETDGLSRVMAAGRFTDVMRAFVPPSEKLFTWWSYRSPDWTRADRGRRLDHIWASPDLAASASSMRVLKEARSWDRPSDHVPVLARFG